MFMRKVHAWFPHFVSFRTIYPQNHRATFEQRLKYDLCCLFEFHQSRSTSHFTTVQRLLPRMAGFTWHSNKVHQGLIHAQSIEVNVERRTNG